MSSTDHHQRQQEAHNRQVQELLQEYVKTYPINLSFPAKVSPAISEKRLRTNVDLVQHRLLESGVLFDDLQQIGQVNEVSESFIKSMMQTGCYHAVQVKLENNLGQEDQSNLHILLNEKNWYSLYIGGGFKQGAIYQHAAGDGVLPKVQFETSGSLLNLTGHLDKTSLSYTVDQTSTATLALTHERPLYSLFSQDSPIHDFILGMAYCYCIIGAVGIICIWSCWVGKNTTTSWWCYLCSCTSWANPPSCYASRTYRLNIKFITRIRC